jgi:hypothetical protein
MALESVRAMAPSAGFPGEVRQHPSLPGQRVQFGRHGCGFGRADLLEDGQRLPQPGFSLGSAAGGQGAPGQAGQGVSFVPGDGNGAGQVQGLLSRCSASASSRTVSLCGAVTMPVPGR